MKLRMITAYTVESSRGCLLVLLSGWRLLEIRSEQICFWLEFGTNLWVTSGKIAVLSRLIIL